MHSTHKYYQLVETCVITDICACFLEYMIIIESTALKVTVSLKMVSAFLKNTYQFLENKILYISILIHAQCMSLSRGVLIRKI